MSRRGSKRLASLDALRGFDMVWIVGGREVVVAAAAWTGWGFLDGLAAQMRHPEWNGFTAWDLIFPLFLFLAGVSWTYSLATRRARGDSDGAIARHVLQRGLTLVALGVLYNIGPSLDFTDVRYASVLGRIGLAWMFAAWIAMRFGARGRGVWIAAILVAYWIALTTIPVPGQGAPSLAPGETLADWVDRHLLPGRLHRGVRDPEGILSTVPAIATALLGTLAGDLLRSGRPPSRRLLTLFAGGAGALALGALWNESFPINKNLWSSSFVLWTAGWSAILLGLFHALLDVGDAGKARTRPAAALAVVGTNALTAYLLTRFVDFESIARWLVPRGAGAGRDFVAATLALALVWLVLLGLYSRRWFLRV